jgi:hypothetical protein
MNKSLGELIRLKIRDDNRSAKEICAALGMSRGNLDKIYKKDSLNSDLLAKVSVLLNHDFFQYVNPFRKAELELEGPILMDGNNEYRTPTGKLHKCLAELHESQKDLDYLEKQFAQLKAHLIDKDRIINLLNDSLFDKKREIETLKEQLKDK